MLPSTPNRRSNANMTPSALTCRRPAAHKSVGTLEVLLPGLAMPFVNGCSAARLAAQVHQLLHDRGGAGTGLIQGPAALALAGRLLAMLLIFL